MQQVAAVLDATTKLHRRQLESTARQALSEFLSELAELTGSTACSIGWFTSPSETLADFQVLQHGSGTVTAADVKKHLLEPRSHDGAKTVLDPGALILKFPILERESMVGLVVIERARQETPPAPQALDHLLVAITTAVTSHRAETVRQKTERRLEIATDLIPQLVWGCKPDGSVVWTNQQFLRYTGLTLQELRDDGWSKTLHPFDYENTLRVWRAATAAGGLYDVECRMRAQDGSYRWFLSRGLPVRDEEGQVVEWFGADTDIHDRKIAESELHRSHQLLEIISEAQSRILDQASEASVFSSLLERVMKVTLSSAGFVAHCRPGGGDRGIALSSLASRGDDTDPGELAELMEQSRIFLANGSVPPARISRSSLHSGSPRIRLLLPLFASGHCVGVAALSKRDNAFEEVDAFGDMRAFALSCGQLVNSRANEQLRRRAEDALDGIRTELAHATRVMTLSQLMVSIAHEINQPLTAVVANGNAGLLWLNRPAPNLAEAKSAVAAAVRDAERAGEIIRRIRDLVKKGPGERTKFDVNLLIQDAILITGTEVKKHRIDVEAQLDSGLPEVFADRVQIQQVVLNLIVNSIEALSRVEERRRRIAISSSRAGPSKVNVCVLDNGMGVVGGAGSPLLFKPFNTSKPSGLGLGLSISRSIVEAHGGELTFVEPPDGGACFAFWLPVLEDRAS